MIGLEKDIKTIHDSQVIKVGGHETRLVDLERSNIRQTISVVVGAAWLAALTGMLLYHLFKMNV